MKKILSLLVLMCLSCMGAWAQTYVTSAEGINPLKSYTINGVTPTEAGKSYRGGLALNGTTELIGTKENSGNRNLAKFAFVNVVNNGTQEWHLWSVEAGKFVNLNTKKGTLVATPTAKVLFKQGTSQPENTTMLYYDNTHVINLGGDNQVTIDNWGGSAGSRDEGNSFYVQEQEAFAIPYFPVLSSGDTKHYYLIKNSRKGKPVSYAGVSAQLTQNAEAGAGSYFYFTSAGEMTNGALPVYIHNAMTTKKLANNNSWTADGVVWYLRGVLKDGQYGISISKTSDFSGNNAWNDASGAGTSVGLYGYNDIGSVWNVFATDVPSVTAPEMSDESTKYYYTIRNFRRNKYADSQNETGNITEQGNVALGSFWYFETATAEGETAEGVVPCYIKNAYTGKYLKEQKPASYTEQKSEARIWYLRPMTRNTTNGDIYTGFGIGKNGNSYSDSWNDEDGNNICNYGMNDDGSIWEITAASAATAYTLANNALSTAAKNADRLAFADYYAYPADAVYEFEDCVNACTLTQGGDIETNLSAVKAVNAKWNEFATLEKTGTPTSGDYIRLKNRAANIYINHSSAEATTFNGSATENDNTVWLIEGNEETGFSFYNKATQKYIGSQTTKSANFPVSDTPVYFDITNHEYSYAVFRVHNQTGDHMYGHVNGGNLVCWNTSEASQWAIDVVTEPVNIEIVYETNTGNTWTVAATAEIGDVLRLRNYNIDFYTNFAWKEGNTVVNGKTTYTITCDEAFPFTVGQPCRVNNVLKNHDLYVKSGSETFTYKGTSIGESLNGDIAYYEGEMPANSNIWVFERVAGTQDAFLVKNYLTGKYLTFQYVNSGRCIATMETTAIESADADKTSYMRVRKSTATNKGENGFVLQHPKYNGLCCSVHIGNGTSEPKIVSSWKAGDESAAFSNETNTLRILDLETYSTNLAATDGEDHYGSIYLPYTMTLPEGVEAYAATQDGEVLKLTQVGGADDVVPAGAYILYGGTSVTSAVLTLGAQATVPAGGNVLTGKFEANVALPTGSNYVLNDKNNVVGFYKYNKTTYPVAKAVFCAGESSSNAFTFRFEDVVTAIDAIHSNNSGAEIFDLQGRRLTKAQQGMNIINGHKVLVK